MVIDGTTAQAIFDIAKNLGLPVTSENEFINSVAGVDLSAPSTDMDEAQKIWEDCGLPMDTFNKITEKDAVRWVKDQILPDVKSYISSKVNESSIPVGYPIPIESLRLVYSGLTDQQIEINISGWEVYRWNSIKFLALYHIFLLADSLKGEYLKKANEFKAVAENMLEALLSSIRTILVRIPGFVDTNPALGVLTIKLPKSTRPRMSATEYFGGRI